MPKLKKRLGQHHLVSGDLCRPLIDFLRPQGRVVVEVGPGGGVLTSPLIAAGARVLAVEMDPEWAFALRRSGTGIQASVVIGDAMTLDWKGLAPGSLIAGNLPYQISTALIERLLPLYPRVLRLGFLVQFEVAERLVALPGTPSYGALSVLVAAYSRARVLARVKRGSFKPPPKVDGAFVGMILQEPPLPAERMTAFSRTVRLAFGLRRKTLRNALAAGWGRERAGMAVAALGRGDKVRAEQLDLGAFLELEEIRLSL